MSGNDASYNGSVTEKHEEHKNEHKVRMTNHIATHALNWRLKTEKMSSWRW